MSILYLFSTPYGHLSLEFFKAWPSYMTPWGRPSICWRDYKSYLAWEQVTIQQEELENVHILVCNLWSCQECIKVLVVKSRTLIYQHGCVEDVWDSWRPPHRKQWMNGCFYLFIYFLKCALLWLSLTPSYWVITFFVKSIRTKFHICQKFGQIAGYPWIFCSYRPQKMKCKSQL